MTRTVDVVVSYLELMRDRSAIMPPPRPLEPEVTVRREALPTAANLAAALYRSVGARWHWVDRLPWTDAEWQDAMHRADVEIWIARVGGEVAGYFELHVDAEAIDLSYLGLMPAFVGRGMGGPLLSAAIARAWVLGKDRITVNTCTLDHPAALPNYLTHGFRVTRTETQHRTLAS